MFTVYKHTSPSGKVYIGITSQNPDLRWRNGNGYHHNEHFFSAIQKYGWDNFKHEILFDNLTQEQAEQIEVELIAQYKSTDRRFGYNCDSGGNVNRTHSDETKDKIRSAHIGMRYNQQFRDKQRKLKIGNKNRLGQKQSDECKRKISKKNKGKSAGNKNFFFGKHFCGKAHPFAKAVERYDLMGNLIDSRDSAEAYAKELGKTNAGHITQVCRGERKSAYGFIWRYSEVK